MKILIVINDYNATGLHRMGWPAKYIMDLHPDIDVKLVHASTIEPYDLMVMAQFDIIHFHVNFGWIESAPTLFPLLQERGIKLVMDLDDYWDLPDEYPLAAHLKSTGNYGKELSNIPLVDYVTTTTEIFAKFIREHNPNVKVLPNSLDPDMEMWKPQQVMDPRICLGWLGSAGRKYDLEVLEEAIAKLDNNKLLTGLYKFVHVGGSQEDVSVFGQGEVDHYAGINIEEYGKMYNNVHICLAPLVRNTFNECRSELKILEAGIMGKPIICEDFGIYHDVINHGENGFLAKDSDDWYLYMKTLILDHATRQKLGTTLQKEVHANYDIKKTVNDRIEFYKSLLEQ